MYFVCDDVNKKDFWKLEELRGMIIGFKVNCFVMGKDAGPYLAKDWIEVGVHGWDHSYPPECERDDQEAFITWGLEALKPYLPKRFGFRAPGFQLTAFTYPILKKLGFSFIAHQRRIQRFDGKSFPQEEIINVHIYDDLGYIKERAVVDGSFKFLSKGLS